MLLIMVPAVTSEAGEAPLMLMRGLLPMRPRLVATKLTDAPEPAVCAKLAKVRSAEFTPVPPGVTVTVEKPCPIATAPNVSDEAVCARPR